MLSLLLCLAGTQSPAAVPFPQGLDGADTRAVPAALPTPDPDRIWFDRPDGADLWARTRAYKMRFGGGTATFVPFLGSSAPRNFPVELELAAVRVAGSPVALDEAAGPVLDGETVTIDHGALTEVYRLEPARAEQLFVLPEAIDGPLSIELRVGTTLVRGESERGLLLTSPHGDVRIHDAVAFDADGRRADLGLRWTATGYAIDVPAAFLAGARFPVVVDPHFTPTVIGSSARDLSRPNAAHDPGTESMVYVYEEAFSATDLDVVVAMQPFQQPLEIVGYADFTTARWTSPDVGTARSSGTALVAAVVDGGPGFSGRIRGRIVTPLPRTIGPVIDLDSGAHPGPKFNVCVGGDPIDRFLVVWERERTPVNHDLHARVFRQDGSPVNSTDILLENSPADYRNPDCSKHNGSSNPSGSAWAVVCDRRFSGGSAIVRARIRWNGAVDQPVTSLALSPAPDLRPSVSSPLERPGPPTYAVVWERDNGPTRVDIHGALIRGDDALPDVNLSLDGLSGLTFFDDELQPVIETDGTAFTVAWQDRLSPLQEQSYVGSITTVGERLTVTEAEVVATTGNLVPMAVSARPGIQSTLPATVVLYEDRSSPGLRSIFRGTGIPASIGLGSVYCAAVPNSSGETALMRASGSGVAGEPVTLYAHRLPVNQFGFFIASRTTGFVPGAGGSDGNLCLGGSIGRFSNQIRNSGASGEIWIDIDTSNLPIPGTPAVVAGEWLRFQAWFRDVNPGPTSNYTAGFTVPFE